MSTKKNERNSPQNADINNPVISNDGQPPIAGTKQKAPPEPNDSVTGKRRHVLNNLPQVHISYSSAEGTPYPVDRDSIVQIIRSQFRPEVWVQQHFYVMFTDDWGKLICIRRIGVGDTYNVQVDVELIIDIARKVRATEVHFALTRPLGNTDASQQTDDFMQAFADHTYMYRFRIGWFFIMTKDKEEDIATEMDQFYDRLIHERKSLRMLL